MEKFHSRIIRMDRPSSSKADSPPDLELAETVARLTRGWMRWGREAGRAAGLSLPQQFLLGGLCESGPIPVSQWVEAIGASPSATTALLNGLEEHGLVRRERARADRRQVLISLTPKGRRLAERIRAGLRDRWSAACAELPGPDLSEAARTLGRIANRMGSDGGHAPRRSGRAATRGSASR